MRVKVIKFVIVYLIFRLNLIESSLEGNFGVDRLNFLSTEDLSVDTSAETVSAFVISKLHHQ